VSSSRGKTRIVAVLVALALACGLTACAPAPPAGKANPNSGPSGTLTVFAAASLKATFTRLAAEFEARNPGTKLTLSFAGSSDLATQITQGAPADVFASADTRNMAKLADAGLLDGSATNFATNVLEIAVPPSNPASVTSFADLARPGTKVVACASQVPCGAAADAVEKAAGVTLSPVSEESSVTDVLGKVASGEADAGLVYVTDVKGAGGGVKGIPFEESGVAVTTYPIATVGSSRNTELAEAFIAMVAGADGRAILSEAGFGAP
jgi:molybdate transport system substrate-binding protein